MKRVPTALIVVDANVILSAVLGRRTKRMIVDIGARRRLVTSSIAEREVRLVASDAARRRSGTEELLDGVLDEIEIVPAEHYRPGLLVAEGVLRNAVASRNGNGRDAHVLSLAWALEADIWSHDRDFAGTGWPSWSSANLVAALTAAGEGP